MSITVKLPDVYKDLARLEPGLTLVVHPAVNCRLEQIVAAQGLSQHGHAAVISRDWESIRWLVAKYVPKAQRQSIGGATCISIGPVNLWLCGDSADLIRVPVSEFELLIVHGAHWFDRDPLLAVRGRFKRAMVTTRRFSPRHWCASLQPIKRLDVTIEVLQADFPDVVAPIELVAASQSFATFCASRLKVRTSKPPEYLTERQAAEAAAQYGTDWFVKKQPPLVSLELSRAQRRTEAMERLGRARGFRKFLIVKPRRVGETLRNLAKNYEIISKLEGAYVMSLADVQGRATTMFEVVKEFCKSDPKAPQVIADNTTTLTLGNGGTFVVGTAGGAAPARSLALQRVHGFEVAYWCAGPRSSSEVERVVAGLSEAAQTGELAFETTPNGREWVYNTYKESKSGLNDWWSTFIRWWDDPTNVARPGSFDPAEIVETLTDEEKELVKLHGLSPAQIAFRRSKKRGLKKLFDQEYPEDDETCFLTSGLCYFDAHFLLELRKRLPQYERKHIAGGYIVEWEQPQPGKQYVIGADTSEGLPGCDPSGYGVIDRSTGAQVAAAHGYFKPAVLAKMIYDAHVRWNRALTGVERENHGHAVLGELVKFGLSRPHQHGGFLYSFKEDRSGWSTNDVTRPIMLNELGNALESGMRVRDADFISECLTFRLQSSGKFEADPGSHDDCVMKWAIAWQMMQHRVVKPGISIVKGAI